MALNPLLEHKQSSVREFIPVMAGERNPASATASYLVAIPSGRPIRLDDFSAETLVADYPCILVGIILSHLHNGQIELRDANATGGGSTAVIRLGFPGRDAQTPTAYINTQFIDCFGAEFYNGITADSDSSVSDATFIVRAM